jgi:hypothetical protein
LSVYLEELSQFVFRSVEIEVPNKDVLHANCLGVSYLSVGDFGSNWEAGWPSRKP